MHDIKAILSLLHITATVSFPNGYAPLILEISTRVRSDQNGSSNRQLVTLSTSLAAYHLRGYHTKFISHLQYILAFKVR